MVFLGFSLIGSGFLLSQINTLNDPWRWVKFSYESGLPSNRVFNIVETYSGKIWAATQNGLAWYNGYYWQSITEDKGLYKKRPDCIVADSTDNLLVIIDNQLYYGGINGFRKIPFIIKGVERKVKDAALFYNYGFLILSDSSLFLLKNESITPYKTAANLNPRKVFNIWNTRGKGLWINTAEGLYKWQQNGWTLKLKASKFPYNFNHFSENIHGSGIAYCTDPEDAVGLWEWEMNGEPTNKKEKVGDIIALDIGPEGEAIIVTASDEIKIKIGDKWLPVINPPPLLKNIIFLKFQDDGDFWAGTEQGLLLHKASSKQWSYWKLPPHDPRNDINEILKTGDGSIWLGTTKGVVILRPSGKIDMIDRIGGSDLNTVTGLAEDDKGHIWISSGSSFEGAFRWDGTVWKHFGAAEGLDAGLVHKIKKDRQGRLWFLGLLRRDFEIRKVKQEPGAYLYENGSFVNWNTEKGLLCGRVLSFAEGLDGSYWFGTAEGLSRWKSDPKDGSRGFWTHWTDKQGLRMNRIFTVENDDSDRLWFGDQNNGLGYIENDKPKYLTTQDGLISDAVWDIRAGENGSLWIAARGGLNSYHDGVWSVFHIDEVIGSTRLWPVLPVKDKVYIGTSGGGLAILNLTSIMNIFPKLVIYPPIISGNTVNLHWRKYSYWGSRNPDEIEVRYRLDNEPWSPWVREEHIFKTDIESGEHTFQVQTKNILGYFKQEGGIVHFVIEPPLFFRPVFFIPVGTLSLGLIILCFVYFTKRQKHNIALKKSELRYRNLFDNANDPIMIFEPKNEIILEVNNKTCEVYGFTKEELIGRSLKEISVNVDRGEKFIQLTLANRQVNVIETSHIKKTGEKIDIIASAAVIDYDGREAILSIHRDITEQKQAEAKIRLLAQTIASAQDYFSITDLENNILFVNDSFVKAYGYSQDELIGNNIGMVRSPLEPAETTEKILQSTINNGWNGELLQRRKDGTDFQAELWTSVVHNEEGNPVALVGVARDITERKQNEEEREKLINELKNTLAEIKTLSGLLPICSSCKKIRNDKGYWQQVESYLMERSDAIFTHGICPECTEKYYPEIAAKSKKQT